MTGFFGAPAEPFYSSVFFSMTNKTFLPVVSVWPQFQLNVFNFVVTGINIWGSIFSIAFIAMLYTTVVS